MNDIKLTQSRADVLRAAAAGEVTHHRYWGRDPDEDKWGRKKVNAAVEFLRKAGLVELGPANGPSMYASKPWRLTPLGEQWLADNPKES
jgi:hypothetical protein